MKKILYALLIPVMFACGTEDSDNTSRLAAAQASLKGKWQKVSNYEEFYDKTGKKTTSGTTTYGPKDYDIFTDTEFSEYLNDQLAITVKYEMVDATHLKYTHNGQLVQTAEIKELTANKLVLYDETINSDGSKSTSLITKSR
jgi:hypothetical protein